VYANTPRAWCKYIWVVLSIFLVKVDVERTLLTSPSPGSVVGRTYRTSRTLASARRELSARCAPACSTLSALSG
jgi:hypothetical protein